MYTRKGLTKRLDDGVGSEGGGVGGGGGYWSYGMDS